MLKSVKNLSASELLPRERVTDMAAPIPLHFFVSALFCLVIKPYCFLPYSIISPNITLNILYLTLPSPDHGVWFWRASLGIFFTCLQLPTAISSSTLGDWARELCKIMGFILLLVFFSPKETYGMEDPPDNVVGLTSLQAGARRLTCGSPGSHG